MYTLLVISVLNELCVISGLAGDDNTEQVCEYETGEWPACDSLHTIIRRVDTLKPGNYTSRCKETKIYTRSCLDKNRGEECSIRDIDCQTGNGADYHGRTTQTKSGLECQSWDVQTPHKHNLGTVGNHNECRNPDGEAGAWCYTTEPGKRWELCDIRECSSCTKECGSENIDCQTGNGADYRGETNETKSGLECQNWNVQTPHKHGFGKVGNHNHCRNPDGETGAWCYTIFTDIRWELCDIRECLNCNEDKMSTKLPSGEVMAQKLFHSDLNGKRTIIIDGSLKPALPNITQKASPAMILLHKYAKKAESNKRLEDDRKHIKAKIPAIGSKKKVLSNGNYGFFSTVLESYNNHWILDMRPEDWFFTFVQKLALAIDKQAKTDVVRKFFVDHEGKKTLTVSVLANTPFEVDYNWFLNQMAIQIKQNIKTPNYVELMTSDFSTSTKSDQIISSINTMNSVQEFFEYRMNMFMCGIPALTMRGTEEDWKNLLLKIEDLEKLVHPIQEQLNQSLPSNWWANIKTISQKLLETYQGRADIDWWYNIIFKTEATGWRRWGSGYSTYKYNATNGWFLTDILGMRNTEYFSQIQNPLVTVPLTLSRDRTPDEESAFIGGIVGYLVDNTGNNTWPGISAFHGWTLCLEPNSTYLDKMNAA